MMDRNAREQMADAIRSYMEEKTRAFEFDNMIAEAANGTLDKTVQIIAEELWFHYDDLVNHKIVASKVEWDFFNRLLLLLSSDGEIEVVRNWRRWHITQVVAAACLVCFAYLATRTTLWDYLLYMAGPFGFASMVLAWFNYRRQKKAYSPSRIALVPFNSVSKLRSVRRRVSGFMKTKYPKPLARRRIGHAFAEKLLWIPRGILWLMVSPIVLFIQILPERESESRVRLPESDSAGHAVPARV